MLTRPYDNVEQRSGGRELKGWLYNFAVGSHILRPEHKWWLLRVAVPMLKADRSLIITLYGMASTTGSASSNKTLSQDRLLAVKRFLQNHDIDRGRFNTSALGEDVADDPDNTEDSYFRAVAVIMGPAPWN